MGRRIEGRFRKTTRQYSGVHQGVRDTDTEVARRLNGDMNSASVSPFSKREEGKGRRRNRNGGGGGQCSLLLLCSQLLMYSPLSRGEEHSSHAHFSRKLPVREDRRLLVR